MMIDQILERLHKVHKNGSGYMACCPAHEDKNPSLRVTERDDKILIKCFSGCETRDIVSAIGLELKDLFADSGLDTEQRQQYAATKRREALDVALGHESMILQLAKAEIEKGHTLSDSDIARVNQARRRIRVIGGSRL